MRTFAILTATLSIHVSMGLRRISSGCLDPFPPKRSVVVLVRVLDYAKVECSLVLNYDAFYKASSYSSDDTRAACKLDGHDFAFVQVP